MDVWIVGLIGLIEGVIYLTKSDPDFTEIYVRNKRS
jgi:type IV secretory pathway TrbD component